MHYDTHLGFLKNTLQKCHMQVLLLNDIIEADGAIDLGLRRLLGWDDDYARFFHPYLQNAQPHTLYKLSDSFLCRYFFLRLPEQETLLCVGPYLEEELSPRQLWEQAERVGFPPQQMRQLQTYYSGVPIFSPNHGMFAMLDAFCETLWGGAEAFSMVDINREMAGDLSPLSLHAKPTPPEDTLQNMEILEKRYEYENQLMQAVSQGLSHKAELLFSSFSQSSFEQRLTDPIRNLKNYCIIMNTLLRKAAEHGGVHPIYLDRVSTDFARRIELVPSSSAVRDLMADMFRSYCRLVRKHAVKQYSPPVQKVIACIDTDPAGDLSLRTLAAMQNLNASYLSALFRRETGETLTQHINRKRIRHATHLLSSTRLQIQTVAQHCGIPDVNYFSKLFKKHTGKSPREYRETVHTSD